ncbi:patatin-like phospholipase family protein [Undibacterium sp. Jales W-56]|uniref:patatin-like phospholipase family protein n=1 Tax=Undibacterium sp. Jales W-56 TaxID=2897325 RepID=UPI0021D04782|nr:patatin-like phospholipase family protein [Undibacterium sp. Jales W-56]MCU6432422.1 patatin-like phospholipase family protein [Undibacterium sp. Jales W-56]
MSLRRGLALCYALFLIVSANCSLAQSEPKSLPLTAEVSTLPPRPKIALVLSGGGARGFAHIGVLRALRAQRVPVDIVVGTSMGAVVGGAYAAGRSVSELEQIVRNTAWDRVLADRPARYDLDFRRKEEDLLLPSRIELAVTKNGLSLPPAAAGNAALEHALTRLLPQGMRDRPINQLGLPFRSVASDLLTGELVEMRDTPLFLSMRASLAVPGVFAPVRLNQRLVVDGGLVSNLPVELARAMGADVVIAVNVGTPLAKENEISSAFGVAQQMLQILTEQNVQRSIKELSGKDILIAPDLSGISFLDFGLHERAINAGEIAALKMTDQLKNLSVSAEQYAALDQHRLEASNDERGTNKALPIAKIEVQGNQYINPKALIAQSGLQTGQALTSDQIRQATTRLYGRGDIDNIETEITDSDGQRNVVIKPSESKSSRNRLRFGLELASDFSDDNHFALSMMHVASSLNSYGAELRSMAKLGSQRQIGTQLWQPLGTSSPWYLAPSAEFGGTAVDLFQQGKKVFRVSAHNSSGTVVLGRQFDNWGDLQFGVSRRFGKYSVILPEDAAAPGVRYYDTTQFVQFRLDTLDSLAFPVRGNLVTALWERSPSKGVGEPSLARSSLTGLSAFQAGDWAGHIYGEWSRSQRGLAPSSLGGFLRLSGTTADSLDGNSVLLGRVVVARRVGDMPTTVGGAIRLGFSAELGGAFGTNQALRFGNLKQAGSAFISMDTRFGPLYFGAGATRSGNSTAYLFLGPVW